MALDVEQRTVAKGIAAGAAFSLAFVLAGAWLLPGPQVGAAPGERVAFALSCGALSSLLLLAGVARIAAFRFFAGEIDGSLPPRSRTLEVHRAYVQNTTEQLLLACFAYLALALTAPPGELVLVPLLTGLFAIGRVAFWLGYLRSPAARAFGFATTFYPTVLALLVGAWRLTVGGLSS